MNMLGDITIHPVPDGQRGRSPPGTRQSGGHGASLQQAWVSGADGGQIAGAMAAMQPGLGAARAGASAARPHRSNRRAPAAAASIRGWRRWRSSGTGGQGHPVAAGIDAKKVELLKKRRNQKNKRFFHGLGGSMKIGTCPSCAAPVEFARRFGGGGVQFCTATLVRNGEVLEHQYGGAAGRSDPYRIGTEGVYKSVHFAVISSIRALRERSVERVVPVV